jgi:pathogenesis-related protein 1
VLLLAAAALAAADDRFARDMLAAHNAVRARVKVPPLKWSAKLAAAAQGWADTLLRTGEFKHSASNHGENLFEVVGDSVSAAEVVGAWAAESQGYNYRSNSCRGGTLHGTCGHYTQIVWRNTREVGCAVARGGGREVWACEYNPPGNYIGQRPY